MERLWSITRINIYYVLLRLCLLILQDTITQCRNTMVSGEVGPVDLRLVRLDISDSAPPRIVFSVSGGRWGRGRLGQLVLQPSAILHLDCIQVGSGF